MNLSEAAIHPDVKRLTTRFPTAVRSSRWDDMERLCKSGEFDKAVALAQKMESRKEILQQNVVARRMRIARVTLFDRIKQMERDFKMLFNMTGDRVSEMTGKYATDLKNLPKIGDRVHAEIVVMRREMKKLINALLWDGAMLGLKNSEDALLPIFKDNWESVQLQEDKLGFGLKKDMANRNTPQVKKTSDKWQGVVDGIIANNAKAIEGGLTLSQNIYSLTTRAEAEIRRQIAAGIADGESAELIARRIKKYLSPQMVRWEDGQIGPMPGAYRSPYKNAMRIARTEVIKVYTQSTMAYAEDKWWIKGVMVTLSPNHEEPDICDDHEGEIMSPAEFAEKIPFHPHCMCYPTYVFDPQVIADIESDTTGPEE